MQVIFKKPDAVDSVRINLNSKFMKTLTTAVASEGDSTQHMVSAHWFFVNTDEFVPSVVKIPVISHIYFFVNLSKL